MMENSLSDNKAIQEILEKIKPPTTPDYNIMYTLQHRIMPKAFYTNPSMFIKTNENDPNRNFNVLNDMFLDAGSFNPYKVTDFNVDKRNVSGNIGCLKFTFPNTEYECLCKFIYCFYNNKDYSDCFYLTIENGGVFSKGMPLICAWDNKTRHINFGAYDKDDDAFEKCIEIYKNTYESKD